jgi:hypothetical protein
MQLGISMRSVFRMNEVCMEVRKNAVAENIGYGVEI